jgi:hypothetical protein
MISKKDTVAFIDSRLEGTKMTKTQLRERFADMLIEKQIELGYTLLPYVSDDRLKDFLERKYLKPFPRKSRV